MSGLRLNSFESVLPNLRVSADDLSVAPGEWLSVEGPSGFGKSTLIRGLMGLTPTRGEIHLCGRSLEKLPPEKRNLGVVFQDQLLFSHLDAFENAVFGIRMRARLDRSHSARVEGWFQELGLQNRLRARIQELSGGERQRVALIRALAFAPDLLILDEAFRGLDAEMIARAWTFLAQVLAKNPIPVVWISHQNEFQPLRRKRLVGVINDNPEHRHFQNHSLES